MRRLTKLPKPRVYKSVLRPEELEHLRRLLLQERASLLALQRQDLQAAAAMQHEGGEDAEELASLEADRDLLLTMSDAEYHHLQEIDQAIERLDAGTYGICLHTGQPIPLARLVEVPWAKYRAEVQEQIEVGLIRAWA